MSGGMMDDSGEEHALYSVVVNHEEQYSIWPADQDALEGGLP
jgi:uncharacterized protein YbdZ (MbtH family)